MSEAELKQYHTIITDCWQLFRNHSTPSAEDAFWESLIKDAEAIYKKHGGSSFAVRVASEMINEIENIFKVERDKREAKQVAMFR